MSACPEALSAPNDETGSMPDAEVCLQALVDILERSVSKLPVGGQLDSRLVAAMNESSTGDGEDGAKKLRCQKQCGAMCVAAIRRIDDQTQLVVTDDASLDLCTEPGRHSPSPGAGDCAPPRPQDL